jgi:hypothetical protein
MTYVLLWHFAESVDLLCLPGSAPGAVVLAVTLLALDEAQT